LDGESPYSAVRKFTDAEEAKSFLAKENAYPRRPHYVIQGGEIGEVYFRDVPGPPIPYPRSAHFDNGWDLVDGDGWRRYRYARPITLRDMHLPSDKGFIGNSEYLSSARSSLLFTFEGGVFLIEDDWRQHRQGQRKTISIQHLNAEHPERCSKTKCKLAKYLRAINSKNQPFQTPKLPDWSDIIFIGYSWFRDPRFKGSEDPPYLEIM
jgi:hypothetical protein